MTREAFLSNETAPLHYHPLSGLPVDGYLGALTEAQQASLEKLEELVEDDDLDIETWRCKPAETRTLMLLRFLRARKFDPPRAFAMLRVDVEWRAHIGLDKMLCRSARDVLGCDLDVVFAYAPHHQQGYDRQGRPVLYEAYGNFQIAKVTPHTTLERLVDFYVWEIERLCRLMSAKSMEDGILVEAFTVVVDLAGWSPRLATRDAFRYVQRKATLDSAHFPERLGQVVMVNAPLIFAWAWKVIASWLDPRTQAKVTILHSEEQWKPALRDLIEPSQLLREYGGEAERSSVSELHGENDSSPETSEESPRDTCRDAGSTDAETEADIIGGASGGGGGGGSLSGSQGQSTAAIAGENGFKSGSENGGRSFEGSGSHRGGSAPQNGICIGHAAGMADLGRRASGASGSSLWRDDAFWRGLGAGERSVHGDGSGGGGSAWWEGPLHPEDAASFYTPPSSPMRTLYGPSRGSEQSHSTAAKAETETNRRASNGGSAGGSGGGKAASAPLRLDISGEDAYDVSSGDGSGTSQNGSSHDLSYFLDSPSFASLQKRLQEAAPLRPDDEAGLAELLSLHRQRQLQGQRQQDRQGDEIGDGGIGGTGVGNEGSNETGGIDKGGEVVAGVVEDASAAMGKGVDGGYGDYNGNRAYTDPLDASGSSRGHSSHSSQYMTPRSSSFSAIWGQQQQQQQGSGSGGGGSEAGGGGSSERAARRHKDTPRRHRRHRRLRLLLACGGDPSAVVPPGSRPAGGGWGMPAPLPPLAETASDDVPGDGKECRSNGHNYLNGSHCGRGALSPLPASHHGGDNAEASEDEGGGKWCPIM